MTLPAELVSRFRCPQCRGKLQDNVPASAFDCEACGLRFAVEQGVPNFILDLAKPITESKPASR